MSIRRDYRVVEMSFDNKDFEKNAQQSISTLDKLKKALNFDKAADSFNQLESAAKVITFQPVIKSIDEVKKSFEGLHAFTKGIWKNISDDAYRTFKNTWNNTIGQIKSGGSARALNIANAQFKLEGLGIEWEKASKDISAAVDGTAYGFDAAANTASQLATAGIELGEAYGGMAHSLKAVSGIAAMTNSSYEEIGYIFSQIASAGKLMGQDAMQISTKGINVTATLAKQLGKTTEEISEMQRKGEISFAMFAEAMNDAFGDQAAKANNTFQGAMSNVKSALSRIGEVFYGPFYKAMITPLNKIRETINRIKKLLDDGDDSTRDLKDRLTELLNTVSNIFSFFMEHTDIRFFKSLADGANKALDKLNDIGHGWEKMLGIFGKKKASEEVDELTESIERLSEKEQEAVRDIWIEGKYGNGEARISAMKAAGFDEDEINRVQSALNRLVESGKTWEEFQKDLNVEVTKTNKELKETDDISNNFISSKIARTLERVGKVFSYIKMTAINLGESVVNVGKIIAESFLTVFPFDKIAGDAVTLLQAIWDLSTRLINLTKNNKTIKRVADDIFKTTYNLYRIAKSLVSIVITAATSLWTVLSKNLKGLDTSKVGLADITDRLATFIEGLADAAKNGDFFIAIFDKVVEVVKKVIDYVKKIPDYIKPAGTKIKNFITDIFDKIQKLTGINITPFIDKVQTLLTKLGNVLDGDFRENGNAASGEEPGIVKKATSVRDKVFSIFSKPSELATGMADWFNNSFKLAEQKIKTSGFSGTLNAFKNFKKSLDKIRENLTININADTFLKSVRTAGSISASIIAIVTALNINKLVDIVKKPAMDLKTIVATIKGLFTSFTGVFKSISKNIDKIGTAKVWSIRSDIITKIALAIAVMSASLVAIALLPFDQMKQGLLAIAMISVSLGFVILSVSKLPSFKKDELNTNLFGAIGLLGLMFGMVTTLAKYSYEDLTKAILAIGFLSTLVVTMTAMLNLSTHLSKEKKKVETVKNNSSDLVATMFAMTFLFSALGGTIIVLTALSKKLGPDGGNHLLTAVKIAAGMFVSVMVGTVAMMAASKFIKTEDVSSIGKAMAITLVALNAMIPVVAVLAYIDSHWASENGKYSAICDAIGTVALGLIVVAGSLAALTKITSGLDVTQTSLALAISLAALNAMIPVIAVMAYIVKEIDDASVWENVIAPIGGMFTVVGGILMLLSETTVSTDILATAGALAIVMASTMALVPMVIAISKLLQKVPFETLKKAMAWFAGLSILMAVIVGVLGYFNTSSAYGITLALAGIALVFSSIGYMIFATLKGVAVIVEALSKGVATFLKLLKTFASMDTSDIDKAAENFKHTAKSFYKACTDSAPLIFEAILNFLKLGNAFLVDAEPLIYELAFRVQKLFFSIIFSFAMIAFTTLEAFIDTLLSEDENGDKLIYRVVKKVVALLGWIVAGIMDAIFEKTREVQSGPLQPGQERQTQATGQSLWEKFCEWVIEALVGGINTAAIHADEIGEAFINVVVAGLHAAADILRGEPGEEVSRAFWDFMSALKTSFDKFMEEGRKTITIIDIWWQLNPGSIWRETTAMWMGYLNYLAFEYLPSIGSELAGWAGIIMDAWWQMNPGVALHNTMSTIINFATWLFGTWFPDTVDKIKRWVRTVFNGIQSAWDERVQPTIDKVTSFIDNVVGKARKFRDDLKEAFGEAAQWAIDAFEAPFKQGSKVLDAAAGVCDTAGNILAEAFYHGTGAGSYNPKTGEAGYWAVWSAGYDAQKTANGVGAKMMSSAGADTIKYYVDAIKNGEMSIPEAISDIATKIGKSSGLKETLMNALGLSDNSLDWNSILENAGVDNEVTITPVLDADQYVSDYNSLMNNYGGYDYSTASGIDTSSALASSIGSTSPYTTSGLSTGMGSEDMAALRQDVRAISEKMARIEVRLDTGALVGGLYAGIDEKLGEQQILAGRGVYA